MNTKFSLALLSTAVMARNSLNGLNGSGSTEFQNFIGLFGKSYGTVTEMNHRMQVWLDNKNTVDGLNASNAGTGVTFAMNETSDLTDGEFKQMQGLIVPWYAMTEKSTNNSSNNIGGGRRLQEDKSISWVDQGKVHPVKQQGGCGSCWAFAAATVQESMQAIKTDKPVVRLSEQEGVDCDASSYGCQGGWMSNYWKMSAEIGSQANETYEYEAQNGSCRNQQGKMIESRAKASSVKMVDVADMKDELQKGPMSIAVAAGNDCWRYYQSGILSADNNCPTGLDHGVAIVGLNESGDKPYWIIQNSWGTGWGNQGFIWIAVEEGEGTSAMNTYVEVMDVEEGYPKRADPDDDEEEEEEENEEGDCAHDEWENELGPLRCTRDSECRGARTCADFGYCMGDDQCDGEEEDEEEDIEPEPVPEMCMIEEDLNDLGPGMCTDSNQCKGGRVCSELYYCVGYSNCEDDKQTEREDKCSIDETLFPAGPHKCSISSHCKGDRTCGTDGFCTGYCNCE